jgi:superfamily II DNA or RNA helicase
MIRVWYSGIYFLIYCTPFFSCMNNINKDKIQKSEFNSLKNNKRVALKWATGVGKTHEVIQLINNTFIKKSKVNVLLLVAEKAHKRNWADEFAKWKLNSRYNVTTECYNSLKNYRDSKWDILILDEAHHSNTEKRLDILSSINAEYVFALSATLPKDILLNLENIFGSFKVSSISLKNAIQSKLLPVPKVNIVEMTLDNVNYNQIITVGRKSKTYNECNYEDRWKYLKNKYNQIYTVIHCTQKQKYDYINQMIEYWKNRYYTSHNDFHKNKWLQYASQRKRFIGDIKTPYVEKLLKSISKSKRFICFCSSITQCKALGSDNAIHSQRADSLSVISDFNKKKINNLFAVGMTTEGCNLKDIELGIIVQLDGKERLFIQKFGRALRAEYPEQYIFYFKNTQDEIYLNKALENIDIKYINILNINQI